MGLSCSAIIQYGTIHLNYYRAIFWLDQSSELWSTFSRDKLHIQYEKMSIGGLLCFQVKTMPDESLQLWL